MFSRFFRFPAMLVLGLGLYWWPWAASRLGCAGAALYSTPFWLAVTLAATESAYLKRYRFISHTLVRTGRLGRLFRPGLLLLLRQGVSGLFLTMLLLVGALAFAPGHRPLLLLDVLLLPLLLFAMERLLRGEIRPDILAPVVRQWAHWVNALLLWLALLGVIFFSAQMDYSGQPWQAVVRQGALEVAVGCDSLALLARLQSVSGALALWAAQNLFSGLQRPEQLLMAWTLFTAIFGVSFLVAWVYSRALVGAWARPWRVGHSRMDGSSG